MTWPLRARFLSASMRAAVLLCLAGLAALGQENVSSGHVHAGEHSVHHRHLYSGPHEHPDADHDQDQDHDHEAPDPRTTATFSVAPALFQPVAASVLVMPLVGSSLLVLRPALLRVARPVLRLLPPRAPPFSIAVPDSSI